MRTTNGLLSVGAIFALAVILGFGSDACAAQYPGPRPGPGSGTYHRAPPPTRHGGHDYYGGSRGSFGLFFAPRPSGYYRTVTETVLVEPERVEQFWVPPAYNTVTDAYGRPQTVLVRNGYMAQRIVPARYETIARQVWVPYGGPSLGFGFRF